MHVTTLTTPDEAKTHAVRRIPSKSKLELQGILLVSETLSRQIFTFLTRQAAMAVGGSRETL